MKPGDIKLGTLAGLPISAGYSAVLGSIILWALASAAALWLLAFSPVLAIVGGFLALLAHWVADMLHQFGHARAARQTGYPMTGIRLWWVLSTAVYPEHEPPLPEAIHARRALGGPVFSLLVAAVAILPVLLLWPVSGVAWWIAVFFFLDNLLTFGIGSFLPLGFTDGSTLLRLRATHRP